MRRIQALRALRDQSGVALPLALLGLVSVSLLVTTALLTSSTEYAISSAHEDAARALYVAEGGLQAYVAENGTELADLAGLPPQEYRPAEASADEAVSVEVLDLARVVLPDQSILRVFSVEAEPVVGGGRRVMSMVRLVIPPPQPLPLNVTSALTLGGDLRVNGNAFNVSGVSTTCGSGGVEAARLASGAQVTTSGGGNNNSLDNFVGVNDAGLPVTGSAALEQTTLSRAALANDVLEGQSLASIIDQLPASVKFGPRFAPAGGTPQTFNGTVPNPPGVAVVDAQGGRVSVTSGTGLLIVVNGGLEMSGSSTFDGVILSEGEFRLSGNPTVRGALISFAYDTTSEIDLDTPSNLANGSISVQYDRCQVNDAAMGFGRLAQESQAPQVQATFSWLEVVG